MGLVKLTVLDLKNKVPKIQGPGVGLAISPLLSLCFFLAFFFSGAGGGCLSLLRVHLLICLGPPFVFITRACVNPIWTLSQLEVKWLEPPNVSSNRPPCRGS